MKNGEERQIAFGWIEDNPWESGDKRERWDYKDWGTQPESSSRFGSKTRRRIRKRVERQEIN